jgi:hypothetical protein
MLPPPGCSCCQRTAAAAHWTLAGLQQHKTHTMSVLRLSTGLLYGWMHSVHRHIELYVLGASTSRYMSSCCLTICLDCPAGLEVLVATHGNTRAAHCYKRGYPGPNQVLQYGCALMHTKVQSKDRVAKYHKGCCNYPKNPLGDME